MAETPPSPREAQQELPYRARLPGPRPPSWTSTSRCGGRDLRLRRPNGSGKTTTLKLLIGSSARIGGKPGARGAPSRPALEIPGRLHAGAPYLYDYLTPAEYLDYAGRLFGMPAARGASGRGSCSPSWASSGPRASPAPLLQGHGAAGAARPGPGERPRARDPGRADVGPRPDREAPRARPDPRPAQGREDVFFSTHILSDAEALCDRVGVLRAGRLIRVGALASCSGWTSSTWR